METTDPRGGQSACSKLGLPRDRGPSVALEAQLISRARGPARAGRVRPECRPGSRRARRRGSGRGSRSRPGSRARRRDARSGSRRTRSATSRRRAGPRRDRTSPTRRRASARGTLPPKNTTSGISMPSHASQADDREVGDAARRAGRRRRRARSSQRRGSPTGVRREQAGLQGVARGQRVALEAAHARERAVQLDDGLAAGGVVQAVDVLRDHAGDHAARSSVASAGWPRWAAPPRAAASRSSSAPSSGAAARRCRRTRDAGSAAACAAACRGRGSRGCRTPSSSPRRSARRCACRASAEPVVRATRPPRAVAGSRYPVSQWPSRRTSSIPTSTS